MILSMTGYGKASATYNDKKITAEIKSLNSKALDLTARIAVCYREKEMELRAMISNTLLRGKVEFSLWVERDETEQAARLNAPLIKKYMEQFQEANTQYGIPVPENLTEVILRLPDAVSKQDTAEELAEEEWNVARSVAEQAVNQLMEFRTQEGKALEQKFREKADNIEALMKSIEPYEKARTEKIRQRLTDALSTIPEVEYDRGRLEQEMIFYIEKLDINEEKQRLFHHLEYFRETLSGEYGQGKKLGFIAQEMGREINTTGSKSNQAEMQNIVVMMKDELEQIKEQVLNVL
ncbi:MAG: YicC/YloC family endoribonuclease [Bacteroidaceae bacterium]|nr:YicC family protein [Bacteroidaceae bacterium]MBR3983092.1 YicC family protein [Bacteroidaceae bacterium]MEE0119294.1 YicC/YloC family endoribonuclease [Bacteroidaceae bacterium]